MSKTQFNKYKHDFRPCDTSRVKMVITMQDTTKLYFKPEPLKSNKSYVRSNEPPRGRSPCLQKSENLDVKSQIAQDQIAGRGESK